MSWAMKIKEMYRTDCGFPVQEIKAFLKRKTEMPKLFYFGSTLPINPKYFILGVLLSKSVFN